MPSPELNYRHQDAVLLPWTPGPAGYDEFGEVKVGDPEAIKVRWVEGRGVGTNADGNQVMWDATVVVGAEVDPNGLFFLGTLGEWLGTGTGSGTEDAVNPELFKVVKVETTPDVKGRATQRTLRLARFRSSAPERT